MPSLYAEIEINAAPNQVWDALVRKEEWRYWNTFLFDCDPNLKFVVGHEVFLAMQRLEGDEDTEFQPVITVVRPDMCLRWVSRIPGLRTEHSFELRETAPGRTRYLHRDNFSGVLANVFLPFIRQDERQGLRRMADQLKRYVERGGRPPQRFYERSYEQDPRYSPRSEPRYRDYPDDRRYPPRDYPPQDYPPRDYPPQNYPPQDYPPDYRDYPDRGRGRRDRY
ncbi:MAG: SRPBCC domain-containing protein [Cyanobacteria bacterium J06626_23]